jgi:predicted ArsR family transcriptional regulator
VPSTPASAGPAREGKTRRAIIKLLKTEGALDSARLARHLRLTRMAVRQHLYALQREKLVTAEERAVPFGRPAKHWQLTAEADRLFPDAYAELSVALVTAVGMAFGPAGLDRVLESRSAMQRADYRARIPASAPLEDKLRELARVRTEEGYMAEVTRERDGYLFVERHCPICAAANACQGFCSTELDLFRAVLGPGAAVERTEHIIAGDRRCVYRVTPSPAGGRRRPGPPARIRRLAELEKHERTDPSQT